MKFLKPNPWKILLTPILFFAISWLCNLVIGLTLMDTSYYGFPLRFFTAWGPCPPGKNCSEFNSLNFFLDLLIWYIISAFAVSLIRKKRPLDEDDKS